jgi:predicted dienelactone hydrolase
MLAAVIDWVAQSATSAEGPLGHKVSSDAIALAGHSLGGKISLLVASEDPRPLAVFGLDPVDAAGGLQSDPVEYPSVTPELMPDIAVPLVLLGETVNAAASGFGQACAPAEDNFHQYYLHAVSPAAEIEVIGADHMSFLDNPDCGLTCSVCPSGTDDPAITRMLTRRYMTALFELILRERAAYRDYLAGPQIAADAAAGLVITANKNGF